MLSVQGSDCQFVWLSQQEEKDRETPKDSLDDLFPNDEEEHGQGSKNNSTQQFSLMLWFCTHIKQFNLITKLFYNTGVFFQKIKATIQSYISVL